MKSYEKLHTFYTSDDIDFGNANCGKMCQCLPSITETTNQQRNSGICFYAVIIMHFSKTLK